MFSKKQGVAHAEASFLGGREKQNGLVYVQWEKRVKKQPSQKAGGNLAPSAPGHGTGAGVQVHILATSMQGFRIFIIKPEFSATPTSVLSSEIWHVSYTLILQHGLYCMHTYPGLQSVVFIRFWIVNPFQKRSVNALEVVRFSFAVCRPRRRTHAPTADRYPPKMGVTSIF